MTSSGAEADWLLTFAAADAGAPNGDGRPWGDGTAMAARAHAGRPPWDRDCSVRPMIGGHDTFNAMCETFEAAIAEANRDTGAAKGHVYLTGLKVNALRDLDPGRAQPWDPSAVVERDQTVLGFVLRMMAAGIDVRMLLWTPTTDQTDAAPELQPLVAEHVSIAAAVQDFDRQLGGKGRGIVALDSRTARPESAALHQKAIVVRVGAVNVAYCGGIDLAFSRRDFGRDTGPHGIGDWQSGAQIPRPKDGWPQQKHLGGQTCVTVGYPRDYPVWDSGRFPEALPQQVYGRGNRHWHDQHLELRGPVVATLEQQFAERWALHGDVRVFDRNPAPRHKDQVQITRPGADGGMYPLAPAEPEPAAGAATVQLWRTIPLRATATGWPLRRGEFTVMAGIAKAVTRATELITIWDQYFWSVPLARLLATRLNAVPTLHLMIVLPPYGTTQAAGELPLRMSALQTLWRALHPDARLRVKVFDLWNRDADVGIYVHAKVQTYDDRLLVCGSANMNRRSLECDAELDCAVLHQPTVRAHLMALYRCVMAPDHADPPPGWTCFGERWLAEYWAEMRALGPSDRRRSAGALVEDPFFRADPDDPRTPNGVAMPCRGLSDQVRALFEPTSIGELSHAATAGSGVPDLAELSVLIERRREP